jgi:hypothetical protein
MASISQIPFPKSGIDVFGEGMNRMLDHIMKRQQMAKEAMPHPSGDVANALFVEQLRSKFGENDPRYLQAKAAHDLGLKGKESLFDYRSSLMQTAPFRALSPTGKTLAESRGQSPLDAKMKAMGVPGANPKIKEVVGEQGYDENGNPVYDEEESISITGDPEKDEIYKRALTKQTTDAAARNIYLRAQNLDKTRKAIDVNDLTRYSGLKGTGQYLLESAKASAGNPSPEFIAHSQAMNSASLMADQMRQFYGDSIQPSAMQRLRELSNPSTWLKDPKVAKAEFDQLNKILDQETETYKNAATAPEKLNKIKFQDGKFSVEKTNDSKNPANILNDDQQQQFAIEMSQQLMDALPEATPKNILETARASGKSVNEVVNYLMKQKQRVLEMQGGQ